MTTQRLPVAAHRECGWRIDAVAPDFRVEDVWDLGLGGGREDFPRLVRLVTAFDADRPGSTASRLLFAAREKIGAALGWDEAHDSAGSLTERLPTDLHAAAPPAVPAGFPFVPLYLTDDEWAAELQNRTVHGVLHLGWVADGDAYRGRLAVLVQPKGVLGRAYLQAIRPFRYLVVYPALIRSLQRRWADETAPS